MKNLFLSIALSLLVIAPCASVSAQTVNSNEVTRWSLGIKGGADYYRVYPFDGERADRISWFPALTVEYSFNPIFGMGIEGGFFNYGRHYSELDYQGHTIDGLLFGSVNLANLFAPGRTKSWFNAYAEAGAGVAFYSYNLGSGYTDYKATPAASLGLNLEFALGKLWALNLGAQYRAYYDDAMGGAALGQYRDYTDALTASFGIRYKFAAHKKNHVRNLTLNEYYPAPSPVVIVDEVPNDDVARRIASLENESRTSKQRIQQLEQKNEELNRDLQKTKEQRPQQVVAPAPAPGNLVLPNITFVLNQKDLSVANRSTLDQIAMQLLNDKNWRTLEIHGYTDSTGSEAINVNLSQRRAQEVADYLIAKGVTASRITVVRGHGPSNPVASNATAAGRDQNRRIEFRINR